MNNQAGDTRQDDETTSAVRRRVPVRVLAAGGLVGALTVAGIGGSSPAEPVAEPSSAITLSMSVDPGQPVPIGLITEEAAASLYGQGFRGQGIDVALVDSGVAPVAGLDQPGKVLYGPDLSNEGGQDNLSNLDTYGHGTHLAGIIAGDDGDQVGGVAPDSRIVSVKVAGATGETDVAQVIAGIDWVVDHKNDNGMNIRVLNLSLGVGGLETTAGDPLSAAVERAWDAGIVVVAAAGNRGNDSGGIDSPALSPYVVAVGGTESYESSGENDVVATWSSSGNEYRTPDVVAPGRSILSLRVPGSMLDQLHPEAAVGERYFRGSGTSQSAAVVSGFTAALLSADPSMTPDQVKFLYELFADDVAAGELLDGSGRIDVDQMTHSLRYKWKAPFQSHPKALPSTCFAVQPYASWPVTTYPISRYPGSGDTTAADSDYSASYTYDYQAVTGYEPVPEYQVVYDSDDAALTDYQILSVQPTEASLSNADISESEALETTLDSEFDEELATAQPLEADAFDSTPAGPGAARKVVAPCGPSWTGGGWNGATWSGGVWSGATWSGATWSGATWSGATWSGATWSGATWSGATWSGATWSGKWAPPGLSGSTWS